MGKKFNPGHHFVESSPFATIMGELGPLKAKFKGGLVRFTWEQLEPRKDAYNWEPIRTRAAQYAAQGMVLSVFVNYKSFADGSIVPAYLQTAEYDGGIIETKPGANFAGHANGANLKLQNDKVQARFEKFLIAMAAEFDTDARIDSIHFQETSLGQPVVAVPKAEVMVWLGNYEKSLRNAMPYWKNTILYPNTNNPWYTAQMQAMSEETGMGMCTADLYPTSRNVLTNGTYSGFWENKDASGENIHPSAIYCNPENYRSPGHDGSATDDAYQDVHGLYRYARIDLRCNQIYWATVKGAANFDGWLKVLAMMRETEFPADAAGGMRSTRPSKWIDDVATVLPAPLSLTVGTPTLTALFCWWAARTGADSYNVYRDGVKVANVTVPKYLAEGLAPATRYGFQVSAVSAAGEGPKSDMVYNTTKTPVPGQVLGVTAAAIKPRSATVTWNVLSTAVTYRVYLNGSVVSSANPNTSFIIEGLTPETVYSVEVSGVNSYGQEGAKSAVMPVTTAALPVPAAPLIELSSLTRGMLEVRWNKPELATGFQLSINGLVAPTTAQVMQIANPTADVDYTFSVKAVSADGVSSLASNTLVVHTLKAQVFTDVVISLSIAGKAYKLQGNVEVIEA
jgi:chitodextrinase